MTAVVLVVLPLGSQATCRGAFLGQLFLLRSFLPDKGGAGRTVILIRFLVNNLPHYPFFATCAFQRTLRNARVSALRHTFAPLIPSNRLWTDAPQHSQFHLFESQHF